MSAGSVLVALPPVIVFFVLQKQFVAGLTLGATKVDGWRPLRPASRSDAASSRGLLSVEGREVQAIFLRDNTNVLFVIVGLDDLP
jgi:hypothetical protein